MKRLQKSAALLDGDRVFIDGAIHEVRTNTDFTEGTTEISYRADANSLKKMTVPRDELFEIQVTKIVEGISQYANFDEEISEQGEPKFTLLLKAGNEVYSRAEGRWLTVAAVEIDVPNEKVQICVEEFGDAIRYELGFKEEILTKKGNE